jgi:hypothetical protein
MAGLGAVKKVTATFCLETPACGRGRVAFGDRQKVAVTFFVHLFRPEPADQM